MSTDDDEIKWSWSRMLFGPKLETPEKPIPRVGTVPKDPDEPDWRGIVKNNVIPLPDPGSYNYGRYQDPNYFWFDTPDYADPFKKMWYAAKFHCVNGMIVTHFMGFWYGLAFTLPNTFKIYTKYFVPFFGGAMIGSAAVIALANLRNKTDDYWNYVAGGLVFSSIIGRKNHIDWWQCSLISVPAAVIFKHNAEVNGSLYPLFNMRKMTHSLSGNSAEHGIASGDLRFGLRGSHGDPGRERQPYA